jgi:hypothetical protein
LQLTLDAPRTRLLPRIDGRRDGFEVALVAADVAEGLADFGVGADDEGEGAAADFGGGGGVGGGALAGVAGAAEGGGEVGSCEEVDVGG